MRLGKDLAGKPIISVTDGRIIGNVKDIYVNMDLTWLTGIFLGQEGLIKRKSLLIPREDVAVFGIDAILVKRTEAITSDREQEESDEWLRLSKLRGRQVDTPGGTKVGTIGDIILGESGQITGFALAKAFVEGPVAELGTIPRDAMVDAGEEDGIMTVDLTKAEQPLRPESAVVEPPMEIEEKPAPAEAEPMVAEVEPMAADVEPMAADIEPMAADIEPIAVDIEPMPTDLEGMAPDAEPVEAEDEPLGMEKRSDSDDMPSELS